MLNLDLIKEVVSVSETASNIFIDPKEEVVLTFDSLLGDVSLYVRKVSRVTS